MKIVAVTGKNAEEDVREQINDVFVVDEDIAAFIRPQHLKDVDFSDCDLVLVPGLTKGGWKSLEKEKGVKIRLGPIHASDIGLIVENIGSLELSHTVPACKLLNISAAKKNKELVDSISDYAFKIGDVEIGGDSRMKVVAEIVDATELEKGDLISKIEYYEESGADIIDLGIPLDFSTESVRKAVKTAIEHSKCPISIDTFSGRAIEMGVKTGVEMVMSISKDNISALEHVGDSAVVVVEREIDELIKTLEKVKKKTERVIADCLLDPVSIANSIVRYHKFNELDSKNQPGAHNPRAHSLTHTPTLMGIGNITEMSDADSIGVNAVLAFIAEELGTSLLFTTEASNKTKGSIRELKIASYMSKSAIIRKTPYKDLGIELLALKEKKFRKGKPIPKKVMQAGREEFIRDPFGDFRIWLKEGKIICNHKKISIVGDNARSITDTVISKKLVSRLDHAAYLGIELKKAEIALKLGKNYTQDLELDFGIYSEQNDSNP